MVAITVASNFGTGLVVARYVRSLRSMDRNKEAEVKESEQRWTYIIKSFRRVDRNFAKLQQPMEEAHGIYIELENGG